MDDSEGEIEYLDEDADIVQQCVQISTINSPILPSFEPKTRRQKSLLVERQIQAKQAKKVKELENDIDYNPRGDLKSVKKRRYTTVQKQPYASPKITPKITPTAKFTTEQLSLIQKRNKLNIKLPDYEDPLCLPVKMLKTEENDVRRLKSWNVLCLDHLKHADDILKPKTGETVSSKRTVVLRNVQHNLTGKIEITVWSKTAAENADGDRKSEVFQCILPKYRESTTLSYNMQPTKKRKGHRTTSTVLLTREDHKEGDVLVVYNSTDAVSAIYKMQDVTSESENEKAPQPIKRHAVETACCKMCAACYQASWRPTRDKGVNKHVTCPLCARTFLSVYNLLSHARTHAAADVRRHRLAFSRILAKFVEYHYKCRICQQRFSGIKQLRAHVSTHTSDEKFLCQMCNHVTQ